MKKPTLLRLLGFLAPFTGWVALSVLLGAATITAGIGLMTTAAYLISAAALHPSIAVLEVAIVGVRFFGLTRGVFRYLERLVSHSVNFRLLAGLRVWLYRALERLAPAGLQTYRSGDLLSRAMADIETLEDFYVRAVAPPLTALLVVAGMGLFLRGFAPLLGNLALAFLLAGGAAWPLLGRALSRRPGRQVVATRARLHAALVDGIQGSADLLAFNREEEQKALIAELSGATIRAQRRMAWIGGLSSALGLLTSNLGMLAVLVAAIPLVRSGYLDGVYLAVVALGTLASFEAVLPLPQAAQTLEGSLHAARRLFELADASPAVSDPPQPAPLPTGNALEVRGLRFRYAAGEAPALDGVELRVEEGQCAALVGPSGAGKSTLINLLLRFWEFSEGEITLGGKDIRQFSQEELRGRMGVISQSTYLFDGTLRENLLLARPAASQEEIERAVRAAQLHETVAGLPQGYDTWIGEHGLRLSGGERQRLAIARAVLKDAPILLLDEPTSHLDALTEQAILRNLLALLPGRTALMVTHRLVGLEAMQAVYVMQNGRIVEGGTHTGLLNAGGLYRRMWESQQL